MDSSKLGSKFVRQAFEAFIPCLLGATFLASCFLLALHVYHAYEGGPFSYEAAGELLLVAVLSLEGIVAVSHLRQARLDSVHEVLVRLYQEYRSFEMMIAVRSLWEFKSKHSKNIGGAYEQVRKKEAEDAAKLPREQRDEAERASLHFKRRVVSQFYQVLGGLYDLKIIPKQVMFTYWTKRDLSIIPAILVPIEKDLAIGLWGKPVVADSVERMLRLYNDAPPDRTA